MDEDKGGEDAGTVSVAEAPEGYIPSRKEVGGYVPPIPRIRLPKTRTQSALVRWLYEMGYQVKDISNSLGIRYQQVRNMVLTKPKRAAREDLPPLVIDLLEMEDAVDILLDMELERTHLEERKQARRSQRQARKADEELGDENYGR